MIVDYIGVVKALRKALADYTVGAGGQAENPLPDKQELIKRILELISSIDSFMADQGFILKQLVDAADFEKLALVLSGANAMSATDEIKKTV